jgi:DNA primase
MFPIHDTRGRLVAFGGRAMEKGAKAKYLNSPETPIFQKGQLLYNYHRARKAISNPQNGARGMIVAEGYMDVIALSRAGFEHAVAPMGTALTEEQLALLWRAGPEPILCFDGDKAGLRAAFRSVERALPLIRPGQTLRFAILPDGQDPDDLIKAKGRGAMEDVLGRAIGLVDMVWEREIQAEPLNSPEARAGLKSRIFAALKEIQHDDVRAQYQTVLLDRFDAEFGRQKKQYGGNSSWNKAPNRRASPALKNIVQSGGVETVREKYLIGAILEWPELLGRVDEALFELEFSSPKAAQMQRALLSYWRVTKAVEKSTLNAHIASEGLETLHREFARDRLLIRAAMGGTDAQLDTRTALWMKEADALSGQDQASDGSDEARSLMADAIRSDNSDALKRRMRASRGDRE